MLDKQIQYLDNLSETTFCSPLNHYVYIMYLFFSIKSSSFLESYYLSDQSHSLSSSKIKFYLRTHPIANVLSTIC